MFQRDNLPYPLQDMNTERCNNLHYKILIDQKLEEESFPDHSRAKPVQLE